MAVLPARAFRDQRNTARYRGIAWELTFGEWLDIWEASGKLAQRGKGIGFYVMARHGDRGPYAVGNVSIQLYEVNARDARTNNPGSQAKSQIRRTGRGRGWSFRRGRFEVNMAHQFIGVFGTQDEAEAAYRVACAKRIEMLRAEPAKAA